MKRFNINLPDEIYEKLRKESFNLRIPMSRIVVDKLSEEIVYRNTKQIKEKIKKTAKELGEIKT